MRVSISIPSAGKPALLLGLLLCGPAAHAWNWATDQDPTARQAMFKESRAVCAGLEERLPPAADRPDKKTAAALKGCDAEALYYGIGEPADPVKARQCAFVQIAHDEGEPYSGSAFGGLAMLMTVYANGVGARRDLDLATALACQIQGAPIEVDSRVKHLQSLKAGDWRSHDFSFCDDVSSGYAGGICAAHDGAIKDAERATRLARLQADWPAARLAAFKPLQEAKEDYISASTDNEVDLSGSLRVAFMIQQDQELNDQFMKVLTALDAGRLPEGNASGFPAADSRLNRVYQQLMQGPPPDGTVTKEGVRATERVWLRYRRAWERFVRDAYPKANIQALDAWLTRQRTGELRDLLP